MKRYLLLVLACLFSLAAAVGGRFALQSYASVVADARAARALVATSNHTADLATATATALRAEVQTLAAQSRAATARADALAQIAARYKSSFNDLVRSAPDTCRPVLAVADSAIRTQDAEIVQLRSAHADDSTSVQRLTLALDTTTAALWTLRAAAVKLSHADAALEAHGRTAWVLRILPKPGVGAVLGLDATGKPNVVFGATLSWQF